MLELSHIFHTTCFPGYAGHLVGWVGWGGWGGDNVCWNFHTYSILHVFHGTQNLTVDLNQTRNVCLLTRLAQDLALAIVIKDPLADLRRLRAGPPRESPRHAHMLVAAFEGLCLVWQHFWLDHLILLARMGRPDPIPHFPKGILTSDCPLNTVLYHSRNIAIAFKMSCNDKGVLKPTGVVAVSVKCLPIGCELD